MKTIVLWMLLLVIPHSLAQDNTVYALPNYNVYYNVFNSSLIPADVARLHGLKRSKDVVYVNVAVVKKSGGNGIPADISGVHRNLMQQKFELEFIEISEPTATYYLAPIRFNNEEILHIDLQAAAQGSDEIANFTLTKKLYLD